MFRLQKPNVIFFMLTLNAITDGWVLQGVDGGTHRLTVTEPQLCRVRTIKKINNVKKTQYLCHLESRASVGVTFQLKLP